jgi:hypothetical protein
VTVGGFLDWQSDLLDNNTTRDYTSQITITHRPVISVTFLPTADVPLFPGSRPCGLETIPRQPHTLTADWRLLTAGPRLQLLQLTANSTVSSTQLNWLKSKSHYDWRPVGQCVLVSSRSGAHDQILITVWQLLFFRYRAPPLTGVRGLSFVLSTSTASAQYSKFAAGPRQHSISLYL